MSRLLMKSKLHYSGQPRGVLHSHKRVNLEKYFSQISQNFTDFTDFTWIDKIVKIYLNFNILSWLLASLHSQ